MFDPFNRRREMGEGSVPRSAVGHTFCKVAQITGRVPIAERAAHILCKPGNLNLNMKLTLAVPIFFIPTEFE